MAKNDDTVGVIIATDAEEAKKQLGALRNVVKDLGNSISKAFETSIVPKYVR